MDTKLQYLVQMCVGVQMCCSLSVGVCQSNKQNRLRPSALLMGERGASRCFDSNLWNYGHLCVYVCVSVFVCVCVFVCVLLGEMAPSACIVSLLDCSASSKLVFWDCFILEHTPTHAYLLGSTHTHTHRHTMRTEWHILVGTVMHRCVFGKVECKYRTYERSSDCERSLNFFPQTAENVWMMEDFTNHKNSIITLVAWRPNVHQ